MVSCLCSGLTKPSLQPFSKHYMSKSWTSRSRSRKKKARQSKPSHEISSAISIYLHTILVRIARVNTWLCKASCSTVSDASHCPEPNNDLKEFGNAAISSSSDCCRNAFDASASSGSRKWPSWGQMAKHAFLVPRRRRLSASCFPSKLLFTMERTFATSVGFRASRGLSILRSRGRRCAIGCCGVNCKKSPNGTSSIPSSACASASVRVAVEVAYCCSGGWDSLEGEGEPALLSLPERASSLERRCSWQRADTEP